MTAAELKHQVEIHGHESYFFTRDTMDFFGDTMRNYGVRSNSNVVDYRGETHECWELYRRQPVKHHLSSSTYFDKQTFQRIFPG